MNPRVIAQAARAGNVIEGMIARLRPGRRGPTTRVVRVMPYRSLGDDSALTVRGRVVHIAPTRAREPDATGAIPAREHLAAIYRAFDVVDVPFAMVRVRSRGAEADGTADEGGYFSVELRHADGQPWGSGWHHADVTLLEAPSLPRHDMKVSPAPSAVAEVHVPSPETNLVIVSDLDDTAMDTHTTRTFHMLRTVLLRSALRRRAVPGVPSLYRALQAGATGAMTNPVCYISSSAWNLYDTIVDYLDAHELPKGPVILHDWGSRQRSFHTVTFEHKGAHVGALLERYRAVPFLLIGDDVNEDPEVYASLATRRPGRVSAIWIRTLTRSRRRLRDIELLRSTLQSAGTELLVAEDTATFEAAAVRRGWIPGG